MLLSVLGRCRSVPLPFLQISDRLGEHFKIVFLQFLLQKLYESHEVTFLMDEQDTVQAYEEQGKASGENGQPASRYEQGLKALSSLDRIKQVEAIEGVLLGNFIVM